MLPPAAGPEARSLAAVLGVSTTLADLLTRRGRVDVPDTRRFLNPKLSELSSPKDMADRDLAAARLSDAIRSGERVAVFGDYDCDGITSAAIMTELIESLGGNPVPLLASRFDGGYGVSATAVEHILGSGARLLVTCDCGSSDHASLSALEQRGVETIVIDHHLVPDAPLPAVAFLNPHRKDCGFPYKGLASCGLALSLGAALRRALGKTLDLRRWLDLVAIGTIADVAPLDGDNRALVRAGLSALGSAHRPGVRALLELAKLSPSSLLTAEDVAYRIAPRLNAPGRLGSAELSLRLLLSRTEEEAATIADQVEQLSSERKAEQERMLGQALQDVAAGGLGERPAIVVGRESWNPGIVGVVAGRLASTFERPAVVVGFEGEVGRGSVRGPKGSRLHDALRRCEHLLTRFGGHQAAAGLELELGEFEQFREQFERACSETGPPTATEDGPADDLVWLAPEDDPYQVACDLLSLEPCGPDNPLPRLAVQGRLHSAREVRGGHLKLELALPQGARLGVFAPNLGNRSADLAGDVVVIGKLRPDAFRGGNAVEIMADHVF